jgi:hypothetical protein
MAADESNRRAGGERLDLQLPVRVQGFDVDGTRWEEMTQGEDISSGGAAFQLRHSVAKGQALVLSLPLPKRYRTFDMSTPSYRVFALVRKIEVVEEGCRLGVMFIGKTAPRGFDENPAIRYLLHSENPRPEPSPADRRVEPRFQVFLNLRLSREAGAEGSGSEYTVAEDLSKSGARVPTGLPVGKGDIVSVEEVGGTFATRAEVRNVFIGKDGVPRLNLRFLDHKIPDRLISS